MTNTLHRTGRAYSLPAVQGIEPRPAYSTYEKRTERVWVLDAADRLGQSTTAYDPDSYSLRGRGHWETREKIVRVDHPATEGTPGVPARYSEDPPRGWNAFARSIDGFYRTGYVEFSVPNGASGVAAGLTPYNPPPDGEGIGHIVHGLLFTNNRVRSLHTGTDLGPYTGADVWRVRATQDEIQFSRNGVLQGSEPNTFDPQPLYLGASLYWFGDQVQDPKIIAESGARATMALPALLMKGTDTSFSEGVLVLPSLSLETKLTFGGMMTLPKLQARGSSKPVAEGAMELSPLRVTGSAGWHIYLQAAGMSRLPAMRMMGLAVPPQVAMADDLALGALQMSAFDHAAADGRLTMPAFYIWAEVGSKDSAALEEAAVAFMGASTSMRHVALIVERMQISQVWAAESLIEAVLDEVMRGDVGWATEALFEALLDDVAAFVATTRQSAMGETWVWNPATGSTTRYTNGFNSYATINGKHYGASDAGLMLLEGDDDAGVQIDAAMNFGTPTFGVTDLKAVENAYVGVAAGGNLLLRVAANGREWVYTMRHFDPLLKQQRFDIGRGIRSNVLELELMNKDGADFEIDTVEWRVLRLGRRIQS